MDYVTLGRTGLQVSRVCLGCIGASSMHAWQFMKALGLQRANRWAPFISMQNYYNLLYREDEREMLRLCESEGIGVTPWSPLARGKLTRPWTAEPPTERAKTDAFSTTLFEKTTEIDRPVIERTLEVAKERGVPAAQLAMAWLLHKPAVTSPIFGATKMQHLDDAVAAVSLKLEGRTWFDRSHDGPPSERSSLPA